MAGRVVAVQGVSGTGWWPLPAAMGGAPTRACTRRAAVYSHGGPCADDSHSVLGREVGPWYRKSENGAVPAAMVCATGRCGETGARNGRGSERSERTGRVETGVEEERIRGDTPGQKSGRIAAGNAESEAEKDDERSGKDERVHAGIVGDLLRFRIEVLRDLVLDLRREVFGAHWSPSESLFMW